MKEKRTEIAIETERVLVVSRSKKFIAWCAACGAEVEMVTVDEAAVLTRLDSRTIYRRVEAKMLHSTETTDGLLLVCLDSLSK